MALHVVITNQIQRTYKLVTLICVREMYNIGLVCICWRMVLPEPNLVLDDSLKSFTSSRLSRSSWTKLSSWIVGSDLNSKKKKKSIHVNNSRLKSTPNFQITSELRGFIPYIPLNHQDQPAYALTLKKKESISYLYFGQTTISHPSYAFCTNPSVNFEKPIFLSMGY